jgi:hypothetical protein
VLILPILTPSTHRIPPFSVTPAAPSPAREALEQGHRPRARAALPLEGYPRVLGLAWPFVAHTDSRFEPETLQRFVQRFQRVQGADHRCAVGRSHRAATGGF